MNLKSILFLIIVLFSVTACGQTEGQFVRVRTVTDVFFSQDTILNIVTNDTTFTDTLFNTVGSVTGPATQTLDTIDLDFLVTAANHPAGTILNPDLITKVPIAWSESPAKSSARYNITGSDIQIREAGWYRISGYLSTNPSSSQRYSGKVYLEKNATLSDEWTATGYSRAMSDQDQTTLYFEFYTQFSAFDDFSITTVCEGGATGAANAVTLNSSASRLFVTPLTRTFVELASGPAGQPGEPGAAGDSAYDLWLAEGNAGTVDDFLNSLVGPAGPSGGPVGPPGPAGESSDTSSSGFHYRLLAGDEGDADPYFGAHPNHSGDPNTGYAGIEFFNSTMNSYHRLFTAGYFGLQIDGFTFFNDGFSTNYFRSESGYGQFGVSNRLLRATTSALQIRYTNPDSLGLQYETDLSAKLKTNARSIPDVGTVQEMIDESGGSPVVGEVVTFTENTTVVVKAGSVYFMNIPNVNGTVRTITFDPSNLQIGDIIRFGTNSSSVRTAIVQSTTGGFVLTSGTGVSIDTEINLYYTTSPFALLWNGANWVFV